MSKYDFQLNLNDYNVVSMIIESINKDSTILEFGSAHGRMTKYLKEEMGCIVDIVEIDEESGKEASQFARNSLIGPELGDIESFKWQDIFKGNKYDYIIFADVLEHLRFPEQVLANTYELLKKDGCVFVSIPNIAHNAVLINLFNDSFPYTETGLLDNTHIHFWGLRDFRKMVDGTGYCITNVKPYYVDIFNTEQSVFFPEDSNKLELLLSSRPHGNIYQYMFQLHKRETGLKGFNASLLSKRTYPIAIYFDLGNGFNEENKITDLINIGQKFTNEIIFESNIVSFRVDPVEGLYSKVYIKVLIDGESECSFSDVNAVGKDQDGFYEFVTLDPWLVVKGPFAKGQLLKIEIIVKDLLIWDAIDRLNQVSVNNFQKTQEYAEELERLHREKQEINNDKISILRRLEQIQIPNLGFKEQIEQILDENITLTEKYKQVCDENNNLALSARQANDAYTSVINSHSWKITAPLRIVMTKFKQTRIGNLIYKTLCYLKYHGMKATIYKVKLYLNSQKKKQVKEFDGDNKTFAQMLISIQKGYYGTVFLGDKIKKLDGYDGANKLVLLIGHDLGLTGAPVALYNLATALKKNGHYPIIIAPSDGNLREAICREDIPVIIMQSLFSSEFISHWASMFDLIIANTIVSYPAIQMLNGKAQQVLWWINEATASYPDHVVTYLPEILQDNIHVYCGGSYAEKILLSYRPSYNVKQLLYCVPDYAQEMISNSVPAIENAEGKTIFAIIGMQEERKGQDVLADAILKMPRELVDRCFFVFVGLKYHPNIGMRVADICAKFPYNTKYIEELSLDELKIFYKQIDCLICASKDDPMPIVVTEALMLSKLVICSENTGSASLIKEMNSGLVYEHNDPKLLSKCVCEVLEGKGKLDDMRLRARATYERYFSESTFCVKVEEILTHLTRIPFQVTSSSFKKLANTLESYFKDEEDELYGYDILEQYDNNMEGKKILLISHELSLTGAPIALQYLAQSLKERGDCPVVLSLRDGKLREELICDGIPVIVYHGLYATDFLMTNAFCFDLIILNTVVTYVCVNQLTNSSTPVLWWIHDSDASYNKGGFGSCLPIPLPRNVNIYCGGQYARDCLLRYYPDYNADIFLYNVPDFADMARNIDKYPLKNLNGKVLFTVIGMLDERKGHDILAQAVKTLDKNEIARCMFLFIGQRLEPEIYEYVINLCNQYPDSVMYIPEVSRKELISVYDQSTCIICSSRDDPMPVFVTEAFLMSKLVICSENTGSAALIAQTGGGLIYENNDPLLLAKQIRYVLKHHDELDDMRVKARLTYEAYFSKTSFVEKVDDLIVKHSFLTPDSGYFNGTVSVVIPTYNAGEPFSSTLELLLSQKGIRQIEVIIVDSGSSDGTVDNCNHVGVKIIQISQSEFSHSYARNLGASQARGDILLFMTQDAMPTSVWWMYHMIEPIIQENIAAVSCKEACPEGTELFYRVAVQIHSAFLGFTETDVVCSRRSCVDSNSLRANAALNDIACAVNRSIFDKYKYRYDYAEDLDLGVRLIKDGYKLKLLSSVQVRHGHNRTPNYYMRRALLESSLLPTILGQDSAKEEINIIALRTVKSYAALLRILQQMRNTIKEDCPTVDFFAILERCFVENIDNEYNNYMPEFGLSYSDEKIEEVVKMMEPYCFKTHVSSYDIINQVKYYCDYQLQPLIFEEEHILDINFQEQIYDCIYKQTALLIGANLARVDADANLLEKIKTFTWGV